MMFTDRAITSASMAKPVSDCHPMRSFAVCVSGIVSVGLNAVMFVSAT